MFKSCCFLPVWRSGGGSWSVATSRSWLNFCHPTWATSPVSVSSPTSATSSRVPWTKSSRWRGASRVRNTWTCHENTLTGYLWRKILTGAESDRGSRAGLDPVPDLAPGLWFLLNTNLELGPELRTDEAVGHVDRAPNPKHGQIRSVLFKSASSRSQRTWGHVFLWSDLSRTGSLEASGGNQLSSWPSIKLILGGADEPISKR